MSSKVLYVATLACLGTSAAAQVYDLPITSTWQVSTDNGTSWNSGTSQVPQTQANVRLRMQISWSSPTPNASEWLNGASFDGYVRGMSGAGSTDGVTNISLRENGTFQRASVPLAGRRVAADLIKIDRGDTLPLGQGTIVNVGNAPVTGGIVFGTPVTVFEYQLDLDGSIGSREAGLVYRAGSPVSVVTTPPVGFTSFNFIALTQPATIVVVPAPTALALAGVGGVVLLRRRR